MYHWINKNQLQAHTYIVECFLKKKKIKFKDTLWCSAGDKRETIHHARSKRKHLAIHKLILSLSLSLSLLICATPLYNNNTGWSVIQSKLDFRFINPLAKLHTARIIASERPKRRVLEDFMIKNHFNHWKVSFLLSLSTVPPPMMYNKLDKICRYLGKTCNRI